MEWNESLVYIFLSCVTINEILKIPVLLINMIYDVFSGRSLKLSQNNSMKTLVNAG